MIALLTAFLLLLQGSVLGQGNILQWDAPTENIDGSQLTDLAGFIVYRGEMSGSYTHQIDVGLVDSLDLKLVSNLELGVLYFFTTIAYDSAGNESDFSNEVSNVLGGGTAGLPGREEPLEPLFAIYPNPFDAFVTVETGGREGVVQVFDLLGRPRDLILVSESGVQTFDTSGFSSGVYLFKFKGRTIKGILLR